MRNAQQQKLFFLLAYPMRVTTADHGPHIYWAQVFTPDALPDATLPRFLGVGTAPRVLCLVQPQWLGFFHTLASNCQPYSQWATTLSTETTALHNIRMHNHNQHLYTVTCMFWIRLYITALLTSHKPEILQSKNQR